MACGEDNMGRLFCLICQRISMEANRICFSTTQNLCFVMLPFSAQKNKRRGPTQTFSNQAFLELGHCSFRLRDDLDIQWACTVREAWAHTPPQRQQNTCGYNPRALKRTTSLPRHTYVQLCVCVSDCWLANTEARLIQRQCSVPAKQLEAHKLLTC